MHKTQEHLEILFHLGFPTTENVPPPKKPKKTIKAVHNIPGDLIYFPMCFDEKYVIRDECDNVLGIESYRNYYKSKADSFKMVWKTTTPEWF